jgi:hypothetical protein
MVGCAMATGVLRGAYIKRGKNIAGVHLFER